MFYVHEFIERSAVNPDLPPLPTTKPITETIGLPQHPPPKPGEVVLPSADTLNDDPEFLDDRGDVQSDIMRLIRDVRLADTHKTPVGHKPLPGAPGKHQRSLPNIAPVSIGNAAQLQQESRLEGLDEQRAPSAADSIRPEDSISMVGIPQPPIQPPTSRLTIPLPVLMEEESPTSPEARTAIHISTAQPSEIPAPVPQVTAAPLRPPQTYNQRVSVDAMYLGSESTVPPAFKGLPASIPVPPPMPIPLQPPPPIPNPVPQLVQTIQQVDPSRQVRVNDHMQAFEPMQQLAPRTQMPQPRISDLYPSLPSQTQPHPTNPFEAPSTPALTSTNPFETNPFEMDNRSTPRTPVKRALPPIPPHHSHMVPTQQVVLGRPLIGSLNSKVTANYQSQQNPYSENQFTQPSDVTYDNSQNFHYEYSPTKNAVDFYPQVDIPLVHSASFPRPDSHGTEVQRVEIPGVGTGQYYTNDAIQQMAQSRNQSQYQSWQPPPQEPPNNENYPMGTWTGSAANLMRIEPLLNDVPPKLNPFQYLSYPRH